MKSWEWLPVSALTVDVTVTEPPDASVESWLAVSVTWWLWPESVVDVYVVFAGFCWSAAGMVS